VKSDEDLQAFSFNGNNPRTIKGGIILTASGATEPRGFFIDDYWGFYVNNNISDGVWIDVDKAKVSVKDLIFVALTNLLPEVLFYVIITLLAGALFSDVK